MFALIVRLQIVFISAYDSIRNKLPPKQFQLNKYFLKCGQNPEWSDKPQYTKPHGYP